jgi:hypothetical protein
MAERWSDGVLEQWNDEMMGYLVLIIDTPVLQYSILMIGEDDA